MKRRYKNDEQQKFFDRLVGLGTPEQLRKVLIGGAILEGFTRGVAGDPIPRHLDTPLSAAWIAYHAGRERRKQDIANGETKVTTWTTKDGREIPIVDMTDDHLTNAIKMLRRNAPNILADYTMQYLALPRPRGDGATMAFERELDELATLDPIEFISANESFRALLREANRRNLTIEEGAE